MKHLLKIISAGLLAVIMAGAITACGGDTSSSGNSDATGGSGKKSTLKIITWTNQPSVKALTDLSKKYMDKYPDIKVEITEVDTQQYPNLYKTRLAANDVDIFSYDNTLSPFLSPQVDWAPGEKPEWQASIEAGNYLDITDQPWVKNWTTGDDACTFDGKVYGIATGANATTGVFYNKKMFADNGWVVPETWAEFEKLCADIKAKNIAPMTCGGADAWPYQMLVNDVIAGIEADNFALSKGLWTGERQFTDTNSMEVYKRMDFINNNMEQGFMGIDYASIPGRFVAGKAAMLPDGAWQAPEFTKADPNFEFGYFPMPGTEKGTNFQGKFDLLLGINAKSENTEASLKWMEMLSDKQNYTEFCNATGFIPTMDVQVENSFTQELLPYVSELKTAWELVYRKPNGAGQYVADKAYNTQFLKSAGGPIATIEELAQLSQKDFDDGKKAVQDFKK